MLLVEVMNLRDDDFRDRVDNIKFIVDPGFLIEHLGFKITRETPREIRAACKVHGGDNTTAFRMNKDRKTWVCFTHKCHEKYGNDLFGLVRCVNNCGFMDALAYLEEFTGTKDVSKDKLIKYRHKKERENFVSHNNTGFERPAVVDPVKLKYYKPYRSSFFLEEGFKEETLDYFEIAGGYSDTDGLIRDIIPIHDDHDNMVAYSLRDIRRDVEADNKYKLTPGFDKDLVLYNLNRIKDVVGISPLIIVEGFKSVWRLYELGIKNVVACMGSGITSGQANLLFTYAHAGVVFFFDNDMAGVTAIGKSYDLLKNKMRVYAEIITEVDENGKGLDPADLTEEQIMYYLNKYI